MITLLARRLLLLTLLPLAATLSAQRADDYDLAVASRIDNIDYDTLSARFASTSVADIEGLWELTDVDGTIAIIADSDNPHLYNIVAVDLTDRSLLPGTVIGHASLTAKQDIYRADMLTDVNKSGYRRSAQFTLNLDNKTGALSFVPVKKGYRLQPWKLMPYMFRNVIKRVDNTRKDLSGALRRYPNRSQRLSIRNL